MYASITYGLMIRLADWLDWYVTIHSAIRYDLMGIISCGESPWGWAPTIRFGVAVDAISDLELLTCLQYDTI